MRVCQQRMNKVVHGGFGNAAVVVQDKDKEFRERVKVIAQVVNHFLGGRQSVGL